MTARTGLANLILQLRGMADAGTAEYTLGTAVYWDDQHVQEVMDRHRLDLDRELLMAIPQHDAGGTISYHEYRSRYGHFEATTGGSAVFIIESATGDNQGTANWTPDYDRGSVTFAADTDGSAMFLTGRSFDLDAAAADIWRTKAAQSAKLFHFSTDGHSLAREQFFEHCLKMAEYYSGRQRLMTVDIYRGDEP